MDTARGRTLEQLKNSFKIHVIMNFILYLMIGSPRMDDEIIYSWCFNSVECFDSTPSAAIIVLDEDLESFLSLRSKQKEISISNSICINL